MEWINVSEALFYTLAWALAFGAAILVFLADPTDQPLRRCFYHGGVSGFLGFACVAILVGGGDSTVGNHWYYLGVAALIGLSARQAEMIRRKMLDFVLSQRLTLKSRDDEDTFSGGDGDHHSGDHHRE